MRSPSLALLACLAAASGSAAVAQPAPRLDACGASGRITGLNPRGDGFLSVRSGPGGKPYREIDRLHNGNAVIVCDEQGPWLAVVYGRSPDDDCGVGTPWPVRKPYAGPCRSGWVHSRYVRMVAG
jgi:hypothetical protein